MASKKFNNSFAAVQQNFKLRQIDLPGTRAQTQEQKHARMENTGRGGGGPRHYRQGRRVRRAVAVREDQTPGATGTVTVTQSIFPRHISNSPPKDAAQVPTCANGFGSSATEESVYGFPRFG